MFLRVFDAWTVGFRDKKQNKKTQQSLQEVFRAKRPSAFSSGTLWAKLGLCTAAAASTQKSLQTSDKQPFDRTQMCAGNFLRVKNAAELMRSKFYRKRAKYSLFSLFFSPRFYSLFLTSANAKVKPFLLGIICIKSISPFLLHFILRIAPALV